MAKRKIYYQFMYFRSPFNERVHFPLGCSKDCHAGMYSHMVKQLLEAKTLSLDNIRLDHTGEFKWFYVTVG